MFTRATAGNPENGQPPAIHPDRNTAVARILIMIYTGHRLAAKQTDLPFKNAGITLTTTVVMSSVINEWYHLNEVMFITF